VLVAGVAVHVERLLRAPPDRTAYAQIEADCRKQVTDQLQRLPGLSAQGMRSAHRAFDGLLANLHKIKFSATARVDDVDRGFRSAARVFLQQLRHVLSPEPAAQTPAAPRSRTPSAAAPSSEPAATRVRQPAAAPQLSAAQRAQLDSVRRQAGALKSQAQAGQPLTAAQLAEGGPARELAHLRQDITALLRSASPALAAYRHELQRTQAVAAGHAAGLYRITAHKAIAGAQQYTEQALKALHGQARTVMKEKPDSALLQALRERLQRGEQPPPAQLTPPGQQQSVTHTNTAQGAVTGVPEEELNRQAREEQAGRLEQAARQAYDELKTGLPGRDLEQYLQDLAVRHGVSVASLTHAIAALIMSDQARPGGVKASATGQGGGGAPIVDGGPGVGRGPTTPELHRRINDRVAVSLLEYDRYQTNLTKAADKANRALTAPPSAAAPTELQASHERTSSGQQQDRPEDRYRLPTCPAETEALKKLAAKAGVADWRDLASHIAPPYRNVPSIGSALDVVTRIAQEHKVDVDELLLRIKPSLLERHGLPLREHRLYSMMPTGGPKLGDPLPSDVDHAVKTLRESQSLEKLVDNWRSLERVSGLDAWLSSDAGARELAKAVIRLGPEEGRALAGQVDALAYRTATDQQRLDVASALARAVLDQPPDDLARLGVAALKKLKIEFVYMPSLRSYYEAIPGRQRGEIPDGVVPAKAEPLGRAVLHLGTAETIARGTKPVGAERNADGPAQIMDRFGVRFRQDQPLVTPPDRSSALVVPPVALPEALYTTIGIDTGGKHIFVIPDIHGNVDLFKAHVLLIAEQIRAGSLDPAKVVIVQLGDLINKGHDAAGSVAIADALKHLGADRWADIASPDISPV
jgi:hypothetical protein